jgi:hypothetical protein
MKNATVLRIAPLTLLVAGATGCALNLKLIDSSVRKPSNVAVYFRVTDWRKDPVPNLTAEQFHIYEDDHHVSTFESKQTILNPEIAAVHYTLLLVDMSGSVVNSGGVPPLVDAASSFAERVGQTQQVAVYAFDGAKELHPIVNFSSGGESVRSGIQALNSYRPRDPSTNLNGAVVEGIQALEQQMNRSTQPLRFGTLVVFTDGTDHAHRVPREELMKALDQVEDSVGVFVIGVGAEIDPGELRSIGRSGAVLSKNPQDVKDAFDKVAARVEGFTKSFYLLSYCSPARAGEHEVRIVADVKKRGIGDLRYQFKADGFTPNCDPNQKPAFDLKRPGMSPRKSEKPPAATHSS